MSTSPLTVGAPRGSMTEFDAPPHAERAQLLNRDFVLLWQAQWVSQLGNQAFSMATVFWTAATTHSATLTGVLMAASMVPTVVLAPVGGALVDRYTRLRILITCDAARGVIAILLALAFVVSPPADRFILVVLATFALGVFSAVFGPALAASVPDLVPGRRLEWANAFQQFSRQASGLLGQGAGGVLFQALGAPALFLLDGLSFLFAAASESWVRLPETPGRRDARVRGGGILADMREGFVHVCGRPGLLAFMGLAAVLNLLLTPMAILLPTYVTENLRADARWYGFLMAAIGAGSIVGYALAGRCSPQGRGRARAVLGLMASLPLVIALLGLIRQKWIALAVIFVTGVLSGAINILVMTTMQRGTRREIRGRVLGLFATVTRVLMPIGMVAGGVVADATRRNVTLVYSACGVLAAAAVLVVASQSTTREFLASAS